MNKQEQSQRDLEIQELNKKIMSGEIKLSTESQNPELAKALLAAMAKGNLERIRKGELDPKWA